MTAIFFLDFFDDFMRNSNFGIGFFVINDQCTVPVTLAFDLCRSHFLCELITTL